MTPEISHPSRFTLWAATSSNMVSIPPTQAHLMVEGVGELANGALHPLMTPTHLLVIVSLGLLLGQRVPLDLKRPILIFAPASAAFLLLTLGGWVREIPESIFIGIALVTAALIASEVRISAWFGGFLCLAAAGVIGLDSPVDIGSGLGKLKTLTGTWLSLNAAVFYIAASTSHAQGRRWARVGIRVLGSWIIAISLMVLAFSLRKSL